MNEQEQSIIALSTYGNHLCSGCGRIDHTGQPTGNTNIKHFRLQTGENSAYVVTYCNECAAKVARFLLDAWKS